MAPAHPSAAPETSDRTSQQYVKMAGGEEVSKRLLQERGGHVGLAGPLTLMLFKLDPVKERGKMVCYSAFVEATIIMAQNLSR